MSLPERLVVIGCGLIGSSAAASARAAGVERIIGVDADAAALETGRALGLFDAPASDDAPRAGDLVLVAVPTLAIPAVLEVLVGADGTFAGGAVVTDAGSVKESVLVGARSLPGGLPARFVPGHPIAGSERSGVTAADPTLFRGRRVILTPVEGTERRGVALVGRFWEALGARVSEMDVGEHDRILAMTSHLPHLLAFALVDTLGRLPEHEDVFALAAGGFRDFTRVASSDPVMWSDIFVANAEPTLAILDGFRADLDTLRALLARRDRTALHELFTRAKALRDTHVVPATLAADAAAEPGETGR